MLRSRFFPFFFPWAPPSPRIVHSGPSFFHDQALGKVMLLPLRDDTQVYKQFVENESFRRFVGDRVYPITSP